MTGQTGFDLMEMLTYTGGEISYFNGEKQRKSSPLPEWWTK